VITIALERVYGITKVDDLRGYVKHEEFAMRRQMRRWRIPGSAIGDPSDVGFEQSSEEDRFAFKIHFFY
jgi:hypothetical protein